VGVQGLEGACSRQLRCILRAQGHPVLSSSLRDCEVRGSCSCSSDAGEVLLFILFQLTSIPCPAEYSDFFSCTVTIT